MTRHLVRMACVVLACTAVSLVPAPGTGVEREGRACTDDEVPTPDRAGELVCRHVDLIPEEGS